MDKFHKNISHRKCPKTFPDTGDGFDYFEAINDLYGMTGEKLQKYMELDFEKSVLITKDNLEYSNNLEYNIWKSKDEIPGSKVGSLISNGSSVGLRVAVSNIDSDVNDDWAYVNFKLTLCYLSHTFMIDIDLPKLRKSWYRDEEYTTVKNISRVFEHNLVEKAREQLEDKFSSMSETRPNKQNLSLTEMKTVKGLHIIGCLDNIEYPLREIELLQILKNYTDPSYMTKSLKDPSRGFCDKIAEVHTNGPFYKNDDEEVNWESTKHLKQAQRIGLEFMNNITPSNRIALFRRVLAENLDFFDKTDPVIRQALIDSNIDIHPDLYWQNRDEYDRLVGIERQAKNIIRNNQRLANKKLALILQSSIMNTKNSGPTMYNIDDDKECKAYFIQTNGCEKNIDKERDILDGRPKLTHDKVNTKYQIPRKFEEFKVEYTNTEALDSSSFLIMNRFSNMVDKCWEYSSNPVGNHIFNTELKELLNNPEDYTDDINIKNLSFTDDEYAKLSREHTNYYNNKSNYNQICNFLKRPNNTRVDLPNRNNFDIAKIVKNKVGYGGIRGNLQELAASRISNENLQDPHPDRLNLTDDLGPLIYQNSGGTLKRDGIEITETL